MQPLPLGAVAGIALRFLVLALDLLARHPQPPQVPAPHQQVVRDPQRQRHQRHPLGQLRGQRRPAPPPACATGAPASAARPASTGRTVIQASTATSVALSSPLPTCNAACAAERAPEPGRGRQPRRDPGRSAPEREQPARLQQSRAQRAPAPPPPAAPPARAPCTPTPARARPTRCHRRRGGERPLQVRQQARRQRRPLQHQRDDGGRHRRRRRQHRG